MTDATLATSVRERPGASQAVILVTASGLTTLMTAILGPVLPQMQEHFAAVPGAPYWTPLAVAAPLVMVAIFSIFAGAAADRLGRKRLLVGGTLLYALVGTAPLWLDSLPAIVASRILVGLADAAVMTASLTLIGDYWHGASRQRILALQTTVASASAIVLNLLGGLLGSLWGWRAPFAVYALTLVLALLMQKLLWEPVVSPRAAAMTVPVVVFDVRLLCGICALALLAGLVFLMVPLHLGFLLQALGVAAPADIGIAQAVNSGGVVAGTLAFGWFVGARLKVPYQLALCAGVSGLGLLGTAWAGSYAQLTSAVALEGAGCGLLLPTLLTWNMRHLPPTHRGLGMGAFTSCLFLGMFLNPLLVVFAAERCGGRGPVIAAFGDLMLGGALIALAVVGLRRRRNAAR